MAGLKDFVQDFNVFELSPIGDWVYSWIGIKTRDEPISAERYLKYAESDLLDGGDNRNLINALTNAKRALHLRMEDMCIGFGFDNWSDHRSFPKMVEYLSRIGVTAPRILNNLNRLRNQVEHDYLIPSRSEVETFIDVTVLFLASTQRWISRLPCDIEMHQDIKTDKGSFVLESIRLSWEMGVVSLRFAELNSSFVSKRETLEFKCPAEGYFFCSRLALENDW
ncbi:hypothetical protein N8H69_20020 [Achromobacter spanius]|uniref:hypothetical protein n=1 Tax=Achromobacter spanius TaxID=217203 RepID=UPI0022277D35|nr:hypothetical protein [Achromobacter spanius]MCW3154841.1 hypothetical protein [Achromobacter spanius]